MAAAAAATESSVRQRERGDGSGGADCGCFAFVDAFMMERPSALDGAVERVGERGKVDEGGEGEGGEEGERGEGERGDREATTKSALRVAGGGLQEDGFKKCQRRTRASERGYKRDEDEVEERGEVDRMRWSETQMHPLCCRLAHHNALREQHRACVCAKICACVCVCGCMKGTKPLFLLTTSRAPTSIHDGHPRFPLHIDTHIRARARTHTVQVTPISGCRHMPSANAASGERQRSGDRPSALPSKRHSRPFVETQLRHTRSPLPARLYLLHCLSCVMMDGKAGRGRLLLSPSSLFFVALSLLLSSRRDGAVSILAGHPA